MGGIERRVPAADDETDTSLPALPIAEKGSPFIIDGFDPVRNESAGRLVYEWDS